MVDRGAAADAVLGRSQLYKCCHSAILSSISGSLRSAVG